MNFRGKIIELSEIQSITTKDNKLFQKREVVIETNERYPQSLMFEVTGNDVNHACLVPGMFIEVELNARATKYNNRWYNSLRAWKIIKKDEKQ